MSKVKRIIGSILMIFAVSIPVTVSMPVSADIVVNSLYSKHNTTSLTISGKNATAVSVVEGYSGKTTKIIFTQALQKKNSTGTWSNIKNSTSKTINDYRGSFSYSYTSLAKGTYRVKTSATVYSGNKNEVITSYSSSETVK